MAEDFIHVDASDLQALAADLEACAEKIGSYLNSAVQQTAMDVKKSAQEKVRRRRGFSTAAEAIDYDLQGFQGFGASVLKAEIGYNLSAEANGAGPLGVMLEFGAPRGKKFIPVKRKGKWVWVPKKGDHPNPVAPGHELSNSLLQHSDEFEQNIAGQIDRMMREHGL